MDTPICKTRLGKCGRELHRPAAPGPEFGSILRPPGRSPALKDVYSSFEVIIHLYCSSSTNSITSRFYSVTLSRPATLPWTGSPPSPSYPHPSSPKCDIKTLHGQSKFCCRHLGEVPVGRRGQFPVQFRYASPILCGDLRSEQTQNHAPGRRIPQGADSCRGEVMGAPAWEQTKRDQL